MIQKLSQICNFLSGHAWKASKFKEEGIPIIRINNMKPNSTDFKYWDWEEDYDPKYFIEEGDILLSLSGTIKTYKWIGEKGLLNQRIVKITPKANVNIDWVYYQLTNVIDRIASKGKDAMIKNVSVTDLKKIEVDVPDLSTQNKIVAILDKSTALVQKREGTITLLDELLRAKFLKMFGDLVINSADNSIQLSEIATITSGITKGRKTKQSIVANVPYLRVANSQDGYFNLDEIKTIDVTQSEIDKYNLRKLDLLITEGGDPDKLGRGAVWEVENSNYIFQNHLYRIRINELEEHSVFWLSYLISSYYGKYYFLKEAKQTSGIATVNKSQVSKFPIPIVPKERQFQFEAFYHKIQDQKEALNQSLIELDNLYNSILQRAFNGRLNFNVDIELDALLAAIDLEQDTEKEKYDIKEIATVYAGRLLERIEEQKFENQTQYKQAKEVVFQMLKEGIIQQEYDDVSKSVKLNLV